jgi:nucleotide-binding universal stress UspA family protein
LRRTYQRGVSFDTFDNRDATDFSLTLNYKHKDFQYTRRSRTFLCGTDDKDYSEFALEWLIDELLDDGDEIVCLRVVEKDSKIASDASIEKLKYREEAQRLLEKVIEKNMQDEKAISLVMELAVGKVQDVFKRMVKFLYLLVFKSTESDSIFKIQIYEPSILIVGTRGRSLGGVQGLLPGSVSKWCLQSSPIPVIVVRPETKRLKKKKKRQADPNREAYNTIREASVYRSHVLDRTNQDTTFVELPSATDAELEAVSHAIGVPKDLKKPRFGGALKKIPSNKSVTSSDPESSPDPDSTSPEEGKAGYFPVGYMRTLAPVATEQAMKSPAWEALEESDDVGDEENGEDPAKLSPNTKRKASIGGDSAWDDDEDDLRSSPFGLGAGGPKPKKEHSASFSENPGWLKAILEKPEPGRRRSSAGRRL